LTQLAETIVNPDAQRGIPTERDVPASSARERRTGEDNEARI
jgi:hypothetical protein